MIDTLLHLALAVVPAVLAITLHEAAHGYAALAMGDDTARNEGRLSLNPFAHIDRVGTILLPGFLIISQLLTIGRVTFMFGWAKPVPVAAWKFRDPRRGMMFVAAAGPAMNFFLAWLTALALHLVVGMSGMTAWVLMRLASYFILSNLVLGLFNLLPIPPLDGGRIAVGLLPVNLARWLAGFERSGIVIVILVVFLLPRIASSMGYDFDPVGEAFGRVIPWAIRCILWLAGHDVGFDASDV